MKNGSAKWLCRFHSIDKSVGRSTQRHVDLADRYATKRDDFGAIRKAFDGSFHGLGFIENEELV